MDKLILFCIFLSILACDDNTFVTIEQFDYRVGQEFEYQYVISEQTEDTVIVIEKSIYKMKVVSTNARVGNISGLIEFKIFDVASPEFYSSSWYRQTEDGLYDVAYKMPGVDPGIQPKKTQRWQLLLNTLLTPSPDIITLNSKNEDGIFDSLIVRDEIRLTAPLPLTLGTQTWTEFRTPFLRKSEVTGAESIKIGNRTENTLVITSSIDTNANVEIISYFNTKGLIKRDVVVKDQDIVTEDSERTGKFNVFFEIQRTK